MRTLLITGANRGLGLEFAKQLSIQDTQLIASCRHPEQAEELKQLAQNRKNITIVKLDVTNDKDILTLANKLKGKALDWLINNAGIAGESGVTVGNVARKNFLHVFNVNCLSALKVSEAFLANLQQGQDKLIINISSVLGSISANESGRRYAYRTSKAGLNCVMRSFALDVTDLGIKVMLLHPGWVRTDMGGADASIDAQTSVTAMLGVIEMHKNNSHAEVLWSYDGSTIGW
jgi:NAD(P)-dependent dehydrogenase (short-subunit alcohol dehydrogenase family)